MFKPAWLEASKPANLINGFKKTGIYPFNRQAIQSADGEGELRITNVQMFSQLFVELIHNCYS